MTKCKCGNMKATELEVCEECVNSTIIDCYHPKNSGNRPIGTCRSCKLVQYKNEWLNYCPSCGKKIKEVEMDNYWKSVAMLLIDFIDKNKTRTTFSKPSKADLSRWELTKQAIETCSDTDELETAMQIIWEEPNDPKINNPKMD